MKTIPGSSSLYFIRKEVFLSPLYVYSLTTDKIMGLKAQVNFGFTVLLKNQLGWILLVLFKKAKDCFYVNFKRTSLKQRKSARNNDNLPHEDEVTEKINEKSKRWNSFFMYLVKKYKVFDKAPWESWTFTSLVSKS